MDYLAGPLLDISFRDQDFDGMASSPFPADSRDRRNMRFDLGYAEDESSEASTSSSTNPRSSSRRDNSRTASDDSDAESTDLSSTEECGVFFGKKTEAEKMYLRQLQPGTPAKSSDSAARSGSSPRVVRKRDSREFHRRKTMVFSKKDRFSLSVQAGNEGRGEWNVMSEDGRKEGIANIELVPGTTTKVLEDFTAPPSPSSPSPLTSHTGSSDNGTTNPESTPSSSTVHDLTVTAALVPLQTTDDVDAPLDVSSTDSEAIGEDTEEDDDGENQSDVRCTPSIRPPDGVEVEQIEGNGMAPIDEGQPSDQERDDHVDELKEADVQVQEPEKAPEHLATGVATKETVNEEELEPVEEKVVMTLNSDLRESFSSPKLLAKKLESLSVGDEGAVSGENQSDEPRSERSPLSDVSAAADDTAVSQTVDCTSTTLDTENDSPLPMNRASNFMSPKYHMRGEAYTSPSLWPAVALDRELSLSPVQAMEGMQLGGSPPQDETLGVRTGGLHPSSPTKHTASVAQLFVENMLGMSTPRRLAPLNSLTPMKSASRPAPSPGMPASAARKPTSLLSAPLAPPQARKLQKLPTVAIQPVIAGSTRDMARKREITSALDAAVFRLAGKATSSPSPAISRSVAQRKVDPGLSKLKQSQRPPPVSGSTSSKPSLLRHERPPSRQGTTADASTASVAPSPYTSAASRPDMRVKPNVTPTLTSQLRMGATLQARLAKQSPTPTPMPSTSRSPGRVALGGRQVPQASTADVSVTSERPIVNSTLGKAVRPMFSTQARGTSLKASGTIPVSYLPRKQTTTVMMSRNVVPGSRPLQSSSFGASTGPSKVAPSLPIRKAVPRGGIAAAAEAARQARASAEPATDAAPVQSLTSLSRAEPRRPSPLTLPPPSSSSFLVPPSMGSRASSPHTDDSTSTTSDQPARAMAGRTPSLRKEKGAMKSQAVLNAAEERETVTDQPMEIEANSSPPDGVEQHIEAEASSRPEQSSQSSERSSSRRGQPHAAPTNGAGPNTSRPVRARQRSLAAQPTTPATLNARSSSVPPAMPSHTSRFPIADKDLQAVTKRNTMRNEVYFCAITRTVVRRDGPRPPSPTSKIRTVADREEEDRRISREERARRRDRTKSGDDTDDEMEEVQPLVFTKHLRGPGDEEDYETPAKSGKRARKSSAVGSPGAKGVRRKRSRPDVSGKMVRWDKGLVILSDRGETRGSSDGDDGALKSCIKKIDLDHLGNIPNAQQSLPDLKRSRITVAVICYDGEEPVVPVAPAPATSSKGKGRA